ncbi:MAG TPA: 16S rRNA (cytidine(1402)-2'-O)-methyltransferase [bacterium]|nr:16S rRNA (cytidine(1402)-2'-O)-methyltransferase [bacterium]
MSEKNAIKPATLYLVATPIGNLEDMTFRALKVLREVQLVAAEDTRNSLKLLTHFGIQPAKLISCFEHNEVKRTSEILDVLGGGGAVALITDAGMPGISDPGSQVVKAVVEKGFAVVPVPGPSALIAALPASGFPASPFTFAGFLPAKASDRQKALHQMKSFEQTLVFYESPHRLRASLKDMMNVFGNRSGVVGRELTKLHEEFVRGNLQELWKHFKAVEPKGEFVVMVEGAEPFDRSMPEKWAGVSIADQLVRMMKDQGLSKTEAVKSVAKLRDLPREVVYRIATEIKWEEAGDPGSAAGPGEE